LLKSLHPWLLSHSVGEENRRISSSSFLSQSLGKGGWRQEPINKKRNEKTPSPRALVGVRAKWLLNLKYNFIRY
jgi:hypothetical protein